MGVLYEIVRHATRRPERSDATGLQETSGVSDRQLTAGAAEQVETSGVSDWQPTVGATERAKTADVAAELLRLSYRSAELELKRQDGRASGWLRLYRKPDA
ncbi:hypothetical protein PA598K_03607 [Paenibacillus sp. 598K]|uniref:hypothetical protein n=1 Tax=Paenibacillus sp. 598K TaxID=1117987 RepID=UPI000FF9CE18|nr:hypothetical protein [Paenibacillus sp. 598K]GBF75217.1 hypothetical protein PA598K_03607 [Paenibacillus sp. 598K]